MKSDFLSTKSNHYEKENFKNRFMIKKKYHAKSTKIVL